MQLISSIGSVPFVLYRKWRPHSQSIFASTRFSNLMLWPHFLHILSVIGFLVQNEADSPHSGQTICKKPWYLASVCSSCSSGRISAFCSQNDSAFSMFSSPLAGFLRISTIFQNASWLSFSGNFTVNVSFSVLTVIISVPPLKIPQLQSRCPENG